MVIEGSLTSSSLQCLLSTQSLLGTVLGAGDPVMDETHTSAAFIVVTVWREDMRQRGKGNQVVISPGSDGPERPTGQGTVTVTGASVGVWPGLSER